MSFVNAARRTLEDEGVLSDNPKDRGGLTKYGITRITLSRYLGRPPTQEDWDRLDKPAAIEIYRALYWNEPRLDLIPYERLAEEVFDFCINSGTTRAVQFLQTLVGAKADGKIGPDTVAAIKKFSPRRLTNDYLIKRGRFLMDLVQHDVSQTEFIEGWYLRVMERLDFAYEKAA